MITHVHSTNVSVNDQDKALDFYVNVLGFSVSMDIQMDTEMGSDMRWLTVLPPGGTTNISLTHTSWGGPVKEDTGIALTTDDIHGDYERMLAAGVKFKSAPEQMPWGDTACHFFDPDGNQFFLNGPAK